MLREFAPAKINLYLHITGRQPDGYHILDSLAAFAGVGDEVRLEPATQFDFIIEGPQSGTLAEEPLEGNLVVRAARAFALDTGKPLDMRLTLIKNLPVASGIGGGSSDAAAVLRLLAAHWGIGLRDQRLLKAAALCGQDVPVCLDPRSCYIAAEGVEDGPELPHCDIVLVNPGKSLSTAFVYKAFKDSAASFSAIRRLESAPSDAAELAAMLKIRHNDLAAPALRLMPEIVDVLKALENEGDCLFARMSGSGATCFGLFPNRDSARRAASALFAAHPTWWVVPTYMPLLCDQRRSF